MSKVTINGAILVFLGILFSFAVWVSQEWIISVNAETSKVPVIESNVIGLKDDVTEIKDDVKWITRKMGKHEEDR